MRASSAITNVIVFLVLCLFFVTPFSMSFENSDKAELFTANMLPDFVSQFAGVIRWVIMGLFSILTILLLKNIPRELRTSKAILFIALFYGVQFLYSLVDGVEYIRFSLMVLFVLLIPPIISLAFIANKTILKYMLYLIVLFLIISIILNGHMILMGERFFGFLNNPNLYGISTVFWLVLLLLTEKENLIGKRFFYMVFFFLFFTMLFTASRNSMVGFLLILMFNYYDQFTKLSLGSVFLFLGFLIISSIIDMSFFMERLFNIFNSIEDSGREMVWQRAYFAIDQNFWLGNGMEANLKIANTGNMHNCYVRFLLNMGIVFTVLTLLMYLMSLIWVFSKRNKVPLVLFGYLLTFALMNIGEDFFVGLGSATFVYLIFIYGLINFYINRKVYVVS